MNRALFFLFLSVTYWATPLLAQSTKTTSDEIPEFVRSLEKSKSESQDAANRANSSIRNWQISGVGIAACVVIGMYFGLVRFSPNTSASLNTGFVSANQRRFMVIIGSALLISEFVHLPTLLAILWERQRIFNGGLLLFCLFSLFALQFIRGRWFIAGAVFLFVICALDIFFLYQAPVTIEGVPFRHKLIVGRLPYLLLHLSCAISALYVYASNRKTRNA